MDSGVLGLRGAEWGTAEGYPVQLGAGQDTHEVMAISTSMRARGIQRPKQQNTDTICLEKSKELVRARKEASCSPFTTRAQGSKT